jgi:hypothetical protein
MATPIRAIIVALTTAAIVVLPAMVLAGPGGEPDFGTTDPLDANPNTYFSPAPGVVFTGSCPWPNSIDQFLPEVGKCLPTAVAWSTDGVRIVSDPLAGEGTGQFTFWCQTRTGLRFIVTVQGLTPMTTYSVTAHDLIADEHVGTIATLRTDAQGNGVVGGTVGLEPGGYDWEIHVGTVLHTLATDPIGFEVF